ncbi:MAG: Outer membrane protein assembly factor BamB [Phycisphaerae bacterium]|nr:Outer membrane protein assembly factor BamB [Phycisphaerae bacterium]
MRRYVCAAAGLILASCGIGLAGDFIDPTALREAGLSKFWQFALALEQGQALADIYLVDDALYCATNDGYVYALDARTGVVRWLRQITTARYRLSSPAHAEGRAVFVTPTQMTVVDRLSGDGIMQTDLWFPAGTGAVSDGVLVYIGSVNHRYYALDLATGLEVWKVQTNGQIASRPALLDGVLYVASDDGALHAGTALRKALRWAATTGSANSADLVADENGLYVACTDHSLYSFDTASGALRWRARLSGPLYAPPVPTPETVYQFCQDDGVVAINTSAQEGAERFRWKLADGRTLLTVDREFAYVLTRSDAIAQVALADGAVRRSIPAPGFALASPSPADGTLMLASPDGRLFCARSRSVPFLRREDLRAAITPPKEPSATTQPAATAPAVAEAGEDFLKTRQGGAPLGGKSKVTRSFNPEAPPEAEKKP